MSKPELTVDSYGYPGRDYPDGRRATIVPLTYGRARICIGPANSLGYDHGY